MENVSSSGGFEDLEVWQDSVVLAEKVYVITGAFPKEELYGLVQQMRRCSISIASNIAEGAGRNTDRDFARFIVIANGSLAELKCQLIIAARLGFVKEEAKQDTLNDMNILGRRLKRLHKVISERELAL